MKLLGIGSRIEHSEFGLGVVTNVTSKHYWVTFIKNGLETIDIDSEFKIIEAVEDEVDTISFYDVEKSLKNLLQKSLKFKKNQNLGIIIYTLQLHPQKITTDMNGF